MLFIVEVDNDGFKVYNSSGTLIDPATDAVVQAVRDRIGEVQAAPTQYTLLDRLREINLVSGIKKIVDALPVGDNVIGRIKITDGTTIVGVTAGGLLTVETQQKAGTYQSIRIADGNSGLLADVIEDATENVNRVAIVGKVSITNPAVPPSTTPVAYAGTPLSFSSSDDTTFTITDGKTLHIQSVFAGAEGDPAEKASKVEVFYSPDGGTTEKIVDRIYLSGDTISLFPDTMEARDGTQLDGVATNQGKIIIRRTHFGGSAKELDCVVRGFEE